MNEIRKGWTEIKKGFYKWAKQANLSAYKGKIKHSSFGWFNAHDRLQFIVMHLRRKQRIEKVLKQKNYYK